MKARSTMFTEPFSTTFRNAGAIPPEKLLPGKATTSTSTGPNWGTVNPLYVDFRKRKN
jgi:hypothetical protein